MIPPRRSESGQKVVGRHRASRPMAIQRFTGARCAHCQGPQIGMAAVGDNNGGTRMLCHPDYGLDCYRLVTVYGHGMPCNCRGETTSPDNDRCYQCGYRRFEHLIDRAQPKQFDFLGNPVPCDDFLEAPASDPFAELTRE